MRNVWVFTTAPYSLQHESELERSSNHDQVERLRVIAGPGRDQVEATYTYPGGLGPYSDSHLGCLLENFGRCVGYLVANGIFSVHRARQGRLRKQ